MSKQSKEIKQNSATKQLSALNLTSEYQELLKGLKDKILSSRLKAAQAVNYQVIELYWHIGKKSLRNKKIQTGVITSLISSLMI